MVLELSGNLITSIGDSIGNMPMIKDLDLSGNMIAKLSDQICSLHKLEVKGNACCGVTVLCVIF